MHNKFSIQSSYKPSGDQPFAIEKIVKFLQEGKKSQVLLGITGSGKTFTMANIIAEISKPALIMVHNKTLAAQLYSEMRAIFPNNAVEYFVSYYDYYQPEAYIARTDSFIEKDSSINEEIDRLRHKATRSLMERQDVIIVSSVSCIYGLGSPDLYYQNTLQLKKGYRYPRAEILSSLLELQYERNDIAFERGKFRVKGENIDIFPAHYNDKAWRLAFFGDELEEIYEFDPLNGTNLSKINAAVIYPNSHFMTNEDIRKKAIKAIEEELHERLKFFKDAGKDIEAHRIKTRTYHDIEMIMETGSCKGIENYSRFFTGSKPGEPPPTLFQYLPKESILFIDESHVTIPQIRAMYNGDRARKMTLVEHGFRLPSALDNRPLTFDEWQSYRPQTIFVSATPSLFEIEESQNLVIEQIVRPTGLLDPECIIRPATGQVDDLLKEIKHSIAKNQRILVTTLTKKMAEDLTNYLLELNLKATYLHSEIHTLERIEIIRDLRLGKIDILVGINLLREGLDIPECGLCAILDADKEGFLRSEVSLIQTIGRAARNSEGRVILYADVMTNSINKAVSETNRRREKQIEYNRINNIIPRTITRAIGSLEELNSKAIEKVGNKEISKLINDQKKMKLYIEKLKKQMYNAASNLEFEKAANIRDEINHLSDVLLKLG